MEPARSSNSRTSRTGRLRAIDSHTGGEPTRVLLDVLPDFKPASTGEAVARLRSEFDWIRRASVLEPRGHDAIVGAMLFPPVSEGSTAGIVFFNNAGYLGMCGHGTIGVAVTMHWVGLLELGSARFDTNAGTVEVDLLDRNTVSVGNVSSYRFAADVKLEVPGVGPISGDVAYGGNWFFLTPTELPIAMNNLAALTDRSVAIRRALEMAGITGAEGAEIDHIELFGPSSTGANSKNFVLCPGMAYDRSPCGTGTSAKLACLASDGLLAPGQEWVQESVTGSRFHARYELADGGRILPTITGSAYITSESQLILDDDDPLRDGIT